MLCKFLNFFKSFSFLAIVVYCAILLYLSSLALLGYFLFNEANKEESFGIETESNNGSTLKICAYVCWGIDCFTFIYLIYFSNIFHCINVYS